MASNYLRRYTNLAPALYLLETKNLTLLSPRSWDDKNDAHYLEAYKAKRKLRTVLAVCFTEASETYHHWRVFTSGSSGVCIIFEKNKLLRYVEGYRGVRVGNVRYRMIRELRDDKPRYKDLPFLKRYPFRDEHEFRILYENSKLGLYTKDIPIGTDSIMEIILSPWIPQALSDSVKNVMMGVDGCSKLRIRRTTLVDNEEWKQASGFIS